MKRKRNPKEIDASIQKRIDVIPPGLYCYGNGKCPYWSINTKYPVQQNGYCSYLKVGDWMDKRGFTLLWDACKHYDCPTYSTDNERKKKKRKELLVDAIIIYR